MSFLNIQQNGSVDKVKPVYQIKPGLNRDVINELSWLKNEPAWLQQERLAAYEKFTRIGNPNWGADLSKINFNQISYYLRSTNKTATDWNDVPDNIKKTFDKLGIIEAEARFLSGVGVQYESEIIYRNLKKSWRNLGVIFCDLSTAVKLYPDLVKKYLGRLVPASDNKYAALNSAVWSGGSFVYVPKNVHLDIPLQAYFRLNAKNVGQFERTLIIADEGSSVSYIEGCTAPRYAIDSLHAAVVEIFAKPHSRIRYTTIQNWSNNVYNLVTKRAVAEEGALVEWIDGNFGSKVTMKYPAVFLKGRGSRGDMLSLAVAGSGQHQDTGAKMLHLASDTSSRIISKSISARGGRTSYRGLVKVAPGAQNTRSKVQCDALLIDKLSRSDTYPLMIIDNPLAQIEHEASIYKIQKDQLFYLRARGFSDEDAVSMIISGFIDPIMKELPMEYAIELNRLIKLEMEGGVA